METSQPLATDSFSYSWLPNSKLPPNDLVEPLRDSTCYSIISTLQEEFQNFNFDTSIIHSPFFLAHADELFSDGLIKPVFLDPSRLESSCNTPDFKKTKKKFHHGNLTRWKTLTSQTLRILSRYFNKLRKKVRCSRKSNKVDDIGKKEWQVKRSPKSVIVHPIGALHDHENSIYEAVLHCKRSIGNIILLQFYFYVFI